MLKIESIDQIQKLMIEVRARQKGFFTNFYLNEFKHQIWIQRGVFFYEWESSSLFLIKKSDEFWNVFFYSTNIEDFSEDLRTFKTKYCEGKMIFDIVGRYAQCTPILRVLKEQGFSEATSLVRMARITTKIDYIDDCRIGKIAIEELPAVNNLLHQYFDEKTEQLPFIEELKVFVEQGTILAFHLEGKLAGFLIYEMNATTLYLRYWFTHPDFRDKKVGSRMLRLFFEEGRDTKRQLFWVIQNNENAIKRYKHYGFKEEDMFDYVYANY